MYSWEKGINRHCGIGEEEDCYEPKLIKIKQLKLSQVIRVNWGGHHTIIIKSQTKKNEKKILVYII